MRGSLSVIVPAFNEEKNIEDALKNIYRTVKILFKDYEVLVMNDGSVDRTKTIAEEAAKANQKIRVINFERNAGFGAMYRAGIKMAKKKYVVMIPGDNEIMEDSILYLLKHVGKKDIIMTYISNPEARPLLRRIMSACFTDTINVLFGLNLGYFNGMVIYETELVQKVRMTTNSYAFQAEILIRLLKSGCSFMELPMVVRPQRVPRTNVFRLNNIVGSFATIAKLFLEIQVRGK